MLHYDVIVLGTGGVGSAALAELAKRGVRTLGIDRFSPPHDRGSSHGATRVIRQAYFEHPNYVPLLLKSYRLWRELESRCGQSLLNAVGLIEIGPPDGVVVPGVRRAAEQHDLTVEEVSPAEIVARWPALRVPKGCRGVFEPAAGYLLVEQCVAANLSRASAAGAELRTNTQVLDWSVASGVVRVRTQSDILTASRLVVAAGPWAGRLIADVGISLTLRRKTLFWFQSSEDDLHRSAHLPVFLYELPTGVYYGFPAIDERGVKFAEHTGGKIVADPLADDRTIDTHERQRVLSALSHLLPSISPQILQHIVCFYTMSPDEHFVVDRHPVHPGVVFAAGLSGHGFKFVPVLGQALADLALDGGSSLPIDFLSLRRFG